MNKLYTIAHLPFSIKRILFLLVLISSLLYSCSSQKKIPKSNGKCVLDFKNTHTLTANLRAAEFNFKYLKAKLSANAELDSEMYSFSIALRIKKDSVIWMSLSKIGIEGARVLITKDSVKFINTIKNSYFIGDFGYLSNFLNTELDFEALQSLLIGNSVTFYDEDEKLKSGVTNCQYTLGTIRKHKLKRVMKKKKELIDPIQSIYLCPETFKIARIIFYEFNPDRNFDATFKNHQALGDQLFPYKINYTINAQKNIVLNLEYSKIELNVEQSFPFKIPANYEAIKSNE
ncbi:MAG: DUF4292 domain-containing protein [Bacteroidia bacterium]